MNGINKKELIRRVADETNEPIGSVGKIIKALFLEMKECLADDEIVKMIKKTK